MLRNILVSCGLMILAAMLIPTAAQVPDEFTNLKLFPKDIGKRELMDAMRGFAGALGVRCTHCHPGPTPGSLTDVDFATDELEAKKVARAMMRMTDEINSKLLPATGRDELTRVRCTTCHRGITDPRPLETMLGEMAGKESVEAAVARYEELRGEYYGSASYDFSPATLNTVAEGLAQGGDLEGAAKFVETNLKHHPDSAYSHIMLGQIRAQSGDKAAAIESMKRAIELEPDNDWAKRMLGRLEAEE